MKGIVKKMLVAALLMSVVPGAKATGVESLTAGKAFKLFVDKTHDQGSSAFKKTLYLVGNTLVEKNKPEGYCEKACKAYEATSNGLSKVYTVGVSVCKSIDANGRLYGSLVQAHPVAVPLCSVAVVGLAGYLGYKAYQKTKQLVFDSRKALANFIAPAKQEVVVSYVPIAVTPVKSYATCETQTDFVDAKNESVETSTQVENTDNSADNINDNLERCTVE